MTRILATGDLHLGLLSHSRPDPDTGLPSALLSAGRCWLQVCDIAEDRGVDVVLVAGDTFHGRDPDAVSLNLFEAGLRQLAGASIPVVVISGNHDGAAVPGRQAVIEVFDDRPSVYAVTRPEVVEVEGLRIACLPWVSRQGLMARRPGISRADAEQAVIDALVQVIGRFRAEGADVLTGHWSLQGALLSSEKDISIISEPVIPLTEVEGPWKVAPFAHIHRHQVLEAGGTVALYSGSADRVSFGEEAEAKVAVEVDVNAGTVYTHELDARRFLTIDVVETPAGLDYTGDDTDVEGVIVRIRNCPPEGAEEWKRHLYADGAAVVRIEPKVERHVRARAETVTEALGEAEAFEEFLRVRGIPEEDRGALREMAKSLMENAE